jgi:hypothetical protein
MARRDEGGYPGVVSDRGATTPAGPFRENPPGGGSFAAGLRWLDPYGPLRGCSDLAASDLDRSAAGFDSARVAAFALVRPFPQAGGDLRIQQVEGDLARLEHARIVEVDCLSVDGRFLGHGRGMEHAQGRGERGQAKALSPRGAAGDPRWSSGGDGTLILTLMDAEVRFHGAKSRRPEAATRGVQGLTGERQFVAPATWPGHPY